jgi:O-antigen/teichoic acid export membrane protein
LALILFAILSVVAILLPEDTPARWALVLFAAGMVCQSVSMGLNVVFQAHGKLYLGASNQVLLTLLQLVLGVTTLWWGGRLLGLGAAYALAAMLSLLLNREVFTRQIHEVSFRKVADWKEFARSSLPVGIGSFFAACSSRLGVTLLALLVGPLQTGLFGAASRITLALGNIPIAIFSAVLPAMAVHQREREPVRALFKKALWVMLLLSVPLALLLAAFAPTLVLLLFDRQYEAASPLLVILAASLIPAFVGMSFSHVLLSQHGLIRRLPWVTGAALAANLAACLVLIPKLGAMGAAWAVLITELVALIGYALSVWDYLSTSRGQGSE